MCECSPANSSCGSASTRRTASSAAPEASEKPNFWSSCAVAMNSCVCASTPVVTRTRTRGRDPGRLRVVGKPGDLLEGVDHDVPHAGGHRLLDLGGQLVVAVQRDQRRVDPGRQRDRELAAGADVHAEAFLGDPAEHGAGAERLGRVVAPAASSPNASTYSRARLRTSASSMMSAGVPNRAARSRTSMPPSVSDARRRGARRAARSPGAARSGPRAAPAGGRRAARPHDAAQPGGRHGSQRCSSPGGATPVPPDVLAVGPDGKNRHRIGPTARTECLFVVLLCISFAASQPLWRADSEQPEPGGEAGPRRPAPGSVCHFLALRRFLGGCTELSTSTVTPASSSR